MPVTFSVRSNDLRDNLYVSIFQCICLQRHQTPTAHAQIIKKIDVKVLTTGGE